MNCLHRCFWQRHRSQLFGVLASGLKRTMADTTLIQYVIVNGEIAKTWPKGAMIAQCCHAVAAVGHLHGTDPDTIKYLEDYENMHKVVLEAKDGAQLTALSGQLETDKIKHVLWIEKPELVPTCVALKPYAKDAVKKYTRKFKLLS